MIGVLKVLSVLGIVCSSAIVTNNYHHKDINDRVVIANEATLDDYATIDFEDDINGGVKILCKQDTDANDFATMTMTLPETIDFW